MWINTDEGQVISRFGTISEMTFVSGPVQLGPVCTTLLNILRYAGSTCPERVRKTTDTGSAFCVTLEQNKLLLRDCLSLLFLDLMLRYTYLTRTQLLQSQRFLYVYCNNKSHCVSCFWIDMLLEINKHTYSGVL